MPRFRTLEEFQPSRDFFIGLDSDGCVFDSMEIKHKECFAPMFIKHWKLQSAAKYARQAWEFANLYSKTRGMNRFPVCLRSLRLLQDWSEAAARGFRVPDLAPFEAFVDSGFRRATPDSKTTGSGIRTRCSTERWSGASRSTPPSRISSKACRPFQRYAPRSTK